MGRSPSCSWLPGVRGSPRHSFYPCWMDSVHNQLFPFYRPGNGGREQLSYKLAGSPAGFEARKNSVQVWVVTTGHLTTLAQPTFLGLDPRLGPGLVGAGAH